MSKIRCLNHNILPGFNIFFGSIDFFNNFINSISSLFLVFLRYSFLSSPIPCSAEIDQFTDSILEYIILFTSLVIESSPESLPIIK